MKNLKSREQGTEEESVDKCQLRKVSKHQVLRHGTLNT
jgi:hypothetical protein